VLYEQVPIDIKDVERKPVAYDKAQNYLIKSVHTCIHP
jgi:hypothetical protein